MKTLSPNGYRWYKWNKRLKPSIVHYNSVDSIEGKIKKDETIQSLASVKKIFKVFVCCHKYIHRVEEIKARVNKWKLGDYLIFVGGEEEKQLEENVIQLKCRDLYEDLPEKMFAIYKYLAANNGYRPVTDDYFWKIDDDVDFMRWNEGREQGLIRFTRSEGLDYAGFKPMQRGEGKRGWHIGRVSRRLALAQQKIQWRRCTPTG